MNKKGFTMIELIVVVAIMGLILVVVVPSVSKLTQNNKYKKFVSFGEAMASASKLYVDQYHEDLWGNMNNTGTRTINMNELVNKSLIKTFNQKNDKCSSGSVSVLKEGTPNNYKYTYTYNISCMTSSKAITCTGDASTSKCMSEGREVYNSNS